MKLLTIGAACALSLTIGLSSAQAATVIHKHGAVSRTSVVRPVIVRAPVAKHTVVRVVKVKPPALVVRYSRVLHGSETYYLRDGIYYRKHAGNYVVVRPVAGMRIASLPRNAVNVRVRGELLFRANDTYYRQVGGEFIVV